VSLSEKTKNIFSQIEIRFTTYLLMVFVALIFFGIVLPNLLVVVFGNRFSEFSSVIYILSILCITTVAALPIIFTGKKKREIEHLMPLFVTGMAALSTSNLPLDRIFYLLSTRTEYGQLAKDSGKIYRLIKDYHMPASEACRFVATKSANQIEADFFSRLSHAIEVGESLERFLKNEQDVVMEEYTLRCEAAIKDMDFFKEIFISITISLVFVAVFISIIPMLTPQNVEVLIFAIVTTFASIEVLFLLIMFMRVPKDSIWYPWSVKMKEGVMTKKDRVLIVSMVVALTSTLLFAVFLSIASIPLSIYIGTVFLPLVISGILVMKEEKMIERRDGIYGAFLRSLGRSADVTGQTMTESVKKLALHKFGPLTHLVKNLERRLSTRISTIGAWQHFASEANSNLIKKFGEIYIHSTLNGARPAQTSLFISNNMARILAVRKKRSILASNYVGVLYGVMVVVSSTLFATIKILEYMEKMISDLIFSSDQLTNINFFNTIYGASFHIHDFTLMVCIMILIHGAVSSIMLVVLKGGHIASASVHFVFMIWIGVVSSLVADLAIGGLLST